MNCNLECPSFAKDLKIQSPAMRSAVVAASRVFREVGVGLDGGVNLVLPDGRRAETTPLALLEWHQRETELSNGWQEAWLTEIKAVGGDALFPEVIYFEAGWWVRANWENIKGTVRRDQVLQALTYDKGRDALERHEAAHRMLEGLVRSLNGLDVCDERTREAWRGRLVTRLRSVFGSDPAAILSWVLLYPDFGEATSRLTDEHVGAAAHHERYLQRYPFYPELPVMGRFGRLVSSSYDRSGVAERVILRALAERVLWYINSGRFGLEKESDLAELARAIFYEGLRSWELEGRENRAALIHEQEAHLLERTLSIVRSFCPEPPHRLGARAFLERVQSYLPADQPPLNSPLGLRFDWLRDFVDTCFWCGLLAGNYEQKEGATLL